MTANLDISSNLGSLGQIASVAPAAAAPSIQPGGPNTVPNSGDFAELLTGYMLKTERQGLTALAAGSVAPGAGLQLLPLGRDLNVITSDTPMPDLASVAAFARAQGLGDAAVLALFGPISPASPVSPATPSFPSSPSPVLSVEGVGLNTANWLDAPKQVAPLGSLLSGRPRNAVDADPISETKTASPDVFAQINTAAYLQSNWLSPATTTPTVPTTPATKALTPTAQTLPAFVPAPASDAALVAATAPPASSASSAKTSPTIATPTVLTTPPAPAQAQAFAVQQLPAFVPAPASDAALVAASVPPASSAKTSPTIATPTVLTTPPAPAQAQAFAVQQLPAFVPAPASDAALVAATAPPQPLQPLQPRHRQQSQRRQS